MRVVIGPKAWDFCNGFSQHKATLLKADGQDITSVVMQVRADAKTVYSYCKSRHSPSRQDPNCFSAVTVKLQQKYEKPTHKSRGGAILGRFQSVLFEPISCVLADSAALDRALLGSLAYTFARIGAFVNLKVEDYYPSGKRLICRCMAQFG
jgi:hypothetical protein